MAFTSGTLTRVSAPVRSGGSALKVTRPTTGATQLNGLTQNTAMTQSVAGKSYTAQCYVRPNAVRPERTDPLPRVHPELGDEHQACGTTSVASLPIDAWTLVKVTAVAQASGDRIIPQIYSTNMTSATAAIVYDDCSLVSN